ncbi:hypothetical protein B0H17DRAFT_1340005 [Mycena rosella]|uniref:Uncharacterized protein n=1 Tax=Mycena rosella TaxID=1033263 RepID=A0AAD7FNU2_MYCRO|nr:hypothetical protein B0H17DRAFT_1340005 [Mycena rosella]
MSYGHQQWQQYGALPGALGGGYGAPPRSSTATAPPAAGYGAPPYDGGGGHPGGFAPQRAHGPAPDADPQVPMPILRSPSSRRALTLHTDFIKLRPEHSVRDNALGFMSNDSGEKYNRCHCSCVLFSTFCVLRYLLYVPARSACVQIRIRRNLRVAGGVHVQPPSQPDRSSKVRTSPSAGAALHRHAHVSPLRVHVRIGPRTAELTELDAHMPRVRAFMSDAVRVGRSRAFARP